MTLPQLPMPWLPGRRRIETVGIGGNDAVIASRPRTVRVPEAYVLANQSPRFA
jgi:hypothetical protein